MYGSGEKMQCIVQGKSAGHLPEDYVQLRNLVLITGQSIVDFILAWTLEWLLWLLCETPIVGSKENQNIEKHLYYSVSLLSNGGRAVESQLASKYMLGRSM